MDFFEVSSKRYSHKEQFLPNPVPHTDLERIAQAGIDAPSGMNRQTVRLVILPDRKSVEPLWAIAPNSGLKTAPAAIAVLTDRTLSPEGSVNFEKEDYSAAVQNMLLAATALGYVSLWLDSPFWDDRPQKKAIEALGLAETFKLWAVLPVGKPDGNGTRREKLSFAERVWYR